MTSEWLRRKADVFDQCGPLFDVAMHAPLGIVEREVFQLDFAGAGAWGLVTRQFKRYWYSIVPTFRVIVLADRKPFEHEISEDAFNAVVRFEGNDVLDVASSTCSTTVDGSLLVGVAYWRGRKCRFATPLPSIASIDPRASQDEHFVPVHLAGYYGAGYELWPELRYNGQ